MPKPMQIALAGLLAATAIAAPLTRAQETPPETAVRVIELAGPAASNNAEISGLAWYGDHLILLAENPDLYATAGNAGAFFALPKDAILAYLDAPAPAPLEPLEIPIESADFTEVVPGFDGFEAIAFAGERAFLMIEAAAPDGTMRGYLVSGAIDPALESLTLDLDRSVMLLPQSPYHNMSYESLLVDGDRLVTFYEINGVAVNPQPVAHAFSLDLEPLADLPFPAIEYRVTDATPPDADGVFWAINYFFPGEIFLRPDVDPLAGMYGLGATHRQYVHVERLVALRLAEDAITLAGSAPVQLVLPDASPRNWEGIARLDDRGFLIVTDKYPQTILGFVALPPLAD